MALWLPGKNQFYLPPQPIQRILSTDEFVRRTGVFLQAASERLLTVGHPYYPITTDDDKVVVPKVSSNQYRVFRVKFPNPNNFAFCDKNIFDADNERLVWGLRGIEISRGQPLGIGATGNPFYNTFADAENPYNLLNRNDSENGDADTRHNIGFDPKQTQMVIVGAVPAQGEHWDVAEKCADDDRKPNDKCPPLELVTTTIQDADMVDIGLGNINFKALQKSKSDAPLDVLNTTCKYPDYLGMIEETYGDSLFFFARREALYARHIIVRAGGLDDEKFPEDLYIDSNVESNKLSEIKRSDRYAITPSGSLVATEQQLFNRPFWLQKSQGRNNGILWHNEVFVTMVDTTRGTNFSINMPATDGEDSTYDNSKFVQFLRHTEEFQLSFILQLCKVSLTPENLAYIQTMDPSIIEDWHLSVTSPPNAALADHYRYIQSIATRCPSKEAEEEPKDRYKDMKFWEIDLTEKLTEELDQTPLGRKFLFQAGIKPANVGKRVATTSSALQRFKAPAAKRRRK